MNDIVSTGQVEVPFYEDQLLVHMGEDGELYVAIRPIVESLGLNWAAQFRRMQRDDIFSEKMKNISVAITATEMRGKGQGAKTFVCLPKQFVSGFLFGINSSRIKDDEVRKKVKLYKEEAHLILDAAFTGDAESAHKALVMKYKRLGYPDAWIEQRRIVISTRTELTGEWKNRGIEGRQYGILTNVIHQHAFDLSIDEHLNEKGLLPEGKKKKPNIRDHMTIMELAITNLGEAATLTEIHETNAQGYTDNLEAARKGGDVAGKARTLYERETGRTVISKSSYIEDRKRLEAGDED